MALRAHTRPHTPPHVGVSAQSHLHVGVSAQSHLHVGQTARSAHTVRAARHLHLDRQTRTGSPQAKKHALKKHNDIIRKACFGRGCAFNEALDLSVGACDNILMRKSDLRVSIRGASAGMGRFLVAEKCLWAVHVQGCVRRGISNDLSPEDFFSLCYSACTYCGREPFNETKWRSRPAVLYNGIDRVDNSLPYTKENCVPCCKDCNQMKSGRSARDFIAACNRVADWSRR